MAARLEGMSEATDRAAHDAVVGAGAIIERAAKHNFAGAHRRGAAHVGGSEPNVESGTLRRSIITTPAERTGPGRYRLEVGPTTIYGRRIELGYPGGTGPGHQHTRAFPYFGPAVEANYDRMHDYAARVFAHVVEER